MAAPTYVLLAGVFCSIFATKVDGGNEYERLGTIPLISPNELDTLIDTDAYVLAFFYESTCTSQDCIRAEEELELAEKHTSVHRLKVVKLNDESKAKEFGIEVYPNLVFFHNGSPTLYPDERIDMENVMEWIEGPRDEVIRLLEDDTFEHLTQAASGATTGDWLILFYNTKCSQLLPTFRAVANRLRQRAVIGRVDTSNNQGLVKRFRISKCPTIKFFRLGNMYDFTLPKADVTTLVNFAEGWYKNSRAVPVPVDQSPFDRLVESVVESLKKNVTEGHAIYIFGAVAVLLLALLVTVLRMGSREKED